MSENQNPMYELIGNGLRVHFTALKSTLIEGSQVEEGTMLGENTSTSLESSRKNVKCGPESGPKRGPENRLENTPSKILNLIRHNPRITSREIAKELKMARSGISKHLHAMQGANIIRRVGPAKGGHWEVIGTETE